MRILLLFTLGVIMAQGQELRRKLIDREAPAPQADYFLFRWSVSHEIWEATTMGGGDWPRDETWTHYGNAPMFPMPTNTVWRQINRWSAPPSEAFFALKYAGDRWIIYAYPHGKWPEAWLSCKWWVPQFQSDVPLPPAAECPACHSFAEVRAQRPDGYAVECSLVTCAMRGPAFRTRLDATHRWNELVYSIRVD